MYLTFLAAPPVNIPKEPQYPKDYESLQDMRKNIAMELLWVQQAINSRKNVIYIIIVQHHILFNNNNF